jgi:hypothetical protein
MTSIWKFTKIGFTGTRSGMTDKQKEAVRLLLKQVPSDPTEFHHGDCVGADAEAHAIARMTGLKIIGHPPNDSKAQAHCDFDEVRPKAYYLNRNRDIVDETEILIACPAEYSNVLRSGTWSTVRYARIQERPIIIIHPNGAMVSERCNVWE